MKIDMETLFRFSNIMSDVIYARIPIDNVRADYDIILPVIKEEAGDRIEFKDAVTLCHAGFFMSHGNLSHDESIHGFNGNVYYEDGACLSTSGLVKHPLEWMEDGWFIKACPHEVDYKKLRYMHESSRGLMLNGKSYEECINK